jgi:hypothetical protein
MFKTHEVVHALGALSAMDRGNFTNNASPLLLYRVKSSPLRRGERQPASPEDESTDLAENAGCSK